MISTDVLPELLGDLYAAPLQPEKWQSFFDWMSRLMKISFGFWMSFDEAVGPRVLASGGFAFVPEVGRLYNEIYAPTDPFGPGALRSPPVSVVCGETLVRPERLARTEMYQDLLSKHEMESMTLLCLSPGANERNFMPLWRRAQDGPMEDASIGFLKALLPHVQTAASIRARLQAAAIQEHFAELALDAMGAAVFLVSAAGNVLHRNRLAAELIMRADGLLMEGASLGAGSAGDHARLRSLIAGVAASAGKGVRLAPGGALAILRQRDRAPLYAAVLPVPEHCRGILGVPCALVFVSDPAAAPKSRGAMLLGLYDLTPSEARLADLLLGGLDVRQAAERMRVTLETARFHMKRVLSKTGTRRQSELMRLMLSLPGQ